MSSQVIETANNMADRIKILAALVAVVLGIASFYHFSSQALVVRLLFIVLGCAIALLITYFSQPGKQFLEFALDSYQETQKVAWPTRKETMQTALAVFAFVLIMGIFLWLTDKSIEWIIYDLVLNGKR